MDLYKAGDKIKIDLINKTYKENFDYVINFLDDETLNDNFERKFSPMDRSLRRELKSTFETIIIGLAPRIIQKLSKLKSKWIIR